MSFSFGAKTATPTFGTPNFGAQQPTNFGAQQPTNFGAQQPTNFGAQQPTNFGATQPTNFGAQQPTNFGAQQPTNFGAQQPTNLSFNAPIATSQPSSLFGNNTLVPNVGLGQTSTIGAAASPFGASMLKPAPTFGTPKLGLYNAPTSMPATSGISFGGLSSTVPSLSLNMGANAMPSVGLNTSFGGLINPAPVTSLGTTFGLGSALPSFGLSETVAATEPLVGLGGVAASATSQKNNTTKTEQLPKDQPLPIELQQTVDNFKAYVKQQKTYSSDVARCSIKEFAKVQADIDSVNTLLNEVEKELQTNRSIAEKLKYDTARGLQQVEMAQRTHDTPVGLQYENTSPLMFFTDLVDNFEREMQNMKLQIENMDKYVKNIGKPSPLNSQDLALGMRRIHDTFVALAGRLQSVHSQVESQKDQYLNFRKYMLNDVSNIFEAPVKEDDALNVALKTINYQSNKLSSGTGPTPFTSVLHPSVVQASAQQNTQSLHGMGTNTGFGMQTNFNLGSSNSSLFGNASPHTSFQLQKPPVGNKRGKQ